MTPRTRARSMPLACAFAAGLLFPPLSGCASHRVAPPTQADLPAATGPGKAHEWRRLAWKDEDGRIDRDAVRDALRQRSANVQLWADRAAARNGGQPIAIAGLNPVDWQELGPANVGGRTRALLIHPTETNRMWAGSVSGGLWHSENGGATWAPVDDWWSNLAIGCLAMDPNNPDVMYAGTGEGFFNGDAIGGMGIYRSTDGGATWSLMPSTEEWDNVCRIAVSPDDSEVILAATRYGGIQRSVNGGESWTNVRPAQGSYYVAFDPTDGQRAVAHIIDYDFGAGDWFHAALYSSDGGATWFEAAPPLNRVNGFYSRIELAHAPSNPAIVYASVAVDGGVIYRSLDRGQSYQLRTTSGASSANWYANPLWVNPTNHQHLLTGGYNIHESLDGGATLVPKSDGYIMTDQPHVDIHSFATDPGFDGVSNRRVFVTTDGGVWMANDIAAASPTSGWTRREASYRTVQYYGAAGDGPSGVIVGGTQDNGTLRLTPDSDQAHLTFGGDGGFCAVDPSNPAYVYGEYVNLRIFRSINAGLHGEYIYSGIDDAGVDANFIAPFILDPTDPLTLLAGGRSLWRTTNARTPSPAWTEIFGPGNDRISAIAVAPTDPDVIWIGLNNGEIRRTPNGTAITPVWTPVDNNGGLDPLPDRYITRILFDPDDADTVYVSLGGFEPDNLLRTTDGGATWTDVTGAGPAGLPEVPIRGIARHPNNPDWLYVGTEVGVFASEDGGQSWSTNDFGPASVSVDELVFLHGSTTLLAATHGRGLFMIDLGKVADLNGDFVVDSADLFVLLGAWGACPAPCSSCAADLNDDCEVDSIDLFTLLSDFD